jgi:dUTP pyrophosphatase
MKIRIKRFDKELPLPAYKTKGAAAFDCVARETTEVAPRTVAYIPLNFALEVPEGYMLLLAPRSSTHKKGLHMANSIGILDPDFRGDEDEVRAAYYNVTDLPITIERGERVAQALVKKIEKVEWVSG